MINFLHSTATVTRDIRHQRRAATIWLFLDSKLHIRSEYCSQQMVKCKTYGTMQEWSSLISYSSIFLKGLNKITKQLSSQSTCGTIHSFIEGLFTATVHVSDYTAWHAGMIREKWITQDVESPALCLTFDAIPALACKQWQKPLRTSGSTVVGRDSNPDPHKCTKEVTVRANCSVPR